MRTLSTWSTILLSAFVVLSGCQRTSTVPIAQNIAQINVSSAPICGGAGAKQAAVRHAAVYTLRSGYDGFIVGGTDYQNNVRVTPGVYTGSSTTGSATIIGNTITGGSNTVYQNTGPIVSGSHDQALLIKMFKVGEPGWEHAVPARQLLGPEWATIIQKDKNTCF